MTTDTIDHETLADDDGEMIELEPTPQLIELFERWLEESEEK
jgi:hypothetical protein